MKRDPISMTRLSWTVTETPVDLPRGPLLTAPEVAALADGTLVDIVWSGGNKGRYEVGHHFETPWAKMGDAWVAPIDFIGERPLTEVRKPEPKDEG